MNPLFVMPCWKCNELEAPFAFDLEAGVVKCKVCGNCEAIDWMSNMIERWFVVLQGMKIMYKAILRAKEADLGDLEESHHV